MKTLMILSLLVLCSCGKPGSSHQASESIPASVCTEMVKQMVLQGTRDNYASDIDDMTEVDYQGKTYLLTDECKQHIKFYPKYPL